MTGRGGSEGRDASSGVRPHIPVLLTEVLAALRPAPGECYVDGTFGAGGYSEAILNAADCRVLALDRDARAVRAAQPLVERFAGRLTVVETPFSAMTEIWVRHFGKPPDGIVLDLGVSSMQLDRPERGFSFMTDGPLDMRMSAHGGSAAGIVNSASETEIADILYTFGEERRSRAIAKAIVARRTETPFTHTLDLANLVERVIGRKPGDRKHPATRTFQGLRIAVNREFDELEQGLAAAEQLLKPGGRLVVVSFHSLEDRIVKEFLRTRSDRAGRGSRHLPEAQLPLPSFRIVNQRSISPSEEEISANPRARSAQLRAAIRTEAKPHAE